MSGFPWYSCSRYFSLVGAHMYWWEQELTFEGGGHEGGGGLDFAMSRGGGGNAWTRGEKRRPDAFGDHCSRLRRQQTDELGIVMEEEKEWRLPSRHGITGRAWRRRRRRLRTGRRGRSRRDGGGRQGWMHGGNYRCVFCWRCATLFEVSFLRWDQSHQHRWRASKQAKA